jgi:serine protease inhibitor
MNMPTSFQTLIVLVIFFCLALVIGCTSSTSDTLTSEQIRIDSSNNNKFAVNLYKELSKRDGNFVFSPYSIHSALTMTYAGAAGTTAKEIADTLHLEGEPAKIHAAQKVLIKNLNSANAKRPFELLIANRLWPQKEHPFLATFQKTLRDNYGADSEPLDFGKNPTEAEQKINAWSDEKTNGKIQNLVSSADFSQDTRLVLTNAVYFKAAWATLFDASKTSSQKFYVAEDEYITASMMHLNAQLRTGHFSFGNDQHGEVLVLPYKAYHLSMMILLPSKDDGLAELEKHLSAENLTKWSSGLHRSEAHIAIPKFKMDHDADLIESLKALGIKAAFDKSEGPSGADFSAMDGTHKLYLSKVKQKAFVEVNEEGTEAAAVTKVQSNVKSAAGFFSADHPFLFLIRDHQSGTILFLGRVVNPNVGAPISTASDAK